MMKRVLISWLVALLAVPAFAEDASKLKSEWGGGDWAWCGSHTFDTSTSEACIGATKKCQTQSMRARNTKKNSYALQMMVALEINENGAYFCPVQIEGLYSDKKRTYTEYVQLGNATDCKWLCKNGQNGERCATGRSEVNSCNPVKFERSYYDKLKRQTSGANIEAGVPWFNWERANSCGVNRTQSHDGILIITRWAPGGHGAWVQPVIVRAQRQGWSGIVSWTAVYPYTGANEVLVCTDGYEPDQNRTDCVPIDSNVCAKAQVCAGWNANDFDESVHMFVVPEGKSCFEFRCKGDNMAFASATDRSCIECPASLRGGPSPVDGTCVKCDSGRVFNNIAKTISEHCGEAIAYTKTDMQYGKGKTKNTGDDISKQCWTQTETDVYRECVKTGKIIESPTEGY